MDFGAILDKWEKQYSGNEFFDKDAVLFGEKNIIGKRRYRLLRKKPEASIDLHGLTREEALIGLNTFFEDSLSKGFEKVLIIHGKGNHSDEGVLGDLTRRFIEKCSFAGETVYNPAREGGKGATWVIFKETTVPGK